MIVYWVVFILMIMFQFVPIRGSNSPKIKLVASLIVFFVYAAIRVDYGRDYLAYKDFFYGIKTYGIYYDRNIEIGYALLNYILPTHRILIIITSAFSCITFYYLFEHFVPQKYYWLAFVLMSMSSEMTFFQLSGLRNAIAINIFILSAWHIKNRKLIYYILLTIIAASFHLSSVIYMFLVYFISSPKKFNKKYLLLWIIIPLVVLIISNSFISTLFYNVNLFTDRYNIYFNKLSEYSTTKSSLSTSFVAVMLFTTMYVLYKYRAVLTDNNIIAFKISLVFLISLLAGAISFRASIWYIPFFIATVPIVLEVVKNDLIKYIYVGTAFSYAVYSFFGVYLQMENFPYYHYYTIFGRIL